MLTIEQRRVNETLLGSKGRGAALLQLPRCACCRPAAGVRPWSLLPRSEAEETSDFHILYLFLCWPISFGRMSHQYPPKDPKF